MNPLEMFQGPWSVAGVMAAARRRRRAVLAAVAVITLLASPIVLRLRVDPDVLNLLPQSGPRVRSFRTYLSAFGSLDRVYIVFQAPEGAAIDDYAPVVDRYVAALRRVPEMARVDAELFAPGKDWGYLADHLFQLLGPEETARALSELTPDGLESTLRRVRGNLALAPASMRQAAQQDPLDFLGLMRHRLSAAQAFVRVDPTREGYVSADGRARLVIATPAKPPFDSEFSQRVVAAVERIAADVRREPATGADDEPLPPLQIDFGGGYHVSVETEREVRREAVFNVVGSLAGILLLLVVVFRSTWLLLAGALPMSVAALWSAAVSGLFSSRVSAASAGASALLFGLGVDGLVLLYARYLEERAGVARPEEAVARLAGSGTSMLLGMMTSAATFLALTLVEFPSLQELGRLIGVGMVFGGLLTWILVPALLPGSVKRRTAPAFRRLPGFVSRHRRSVLVAAGLVTLVLGASIPWLRVDLSLQRLQPKTPRMQLEREIARRFGLPEDVCIVLGEGARLEPLLEKDEALGRAVAASGSKAPVFSATSVLPSAGRQARVAAVLERAETGEVPGLLAQAAEATGFRPAAFAPFVERWGRLTDPRARLTYDGFLQHGLAEVVSPYIARTAGGFVTAAYVRPGSPADVETLRRVVAEVGGLTLTGLPLVNEELAQTLVPQFAIGVAIGAVAVAALMLWIFRRPSLTLLALLPTALGIVWSAGVLALLGVQLDLFSMFGILAFIGIGVDYGIHLVHRYAAEEDFAEALARIAPVNLVAAGIAVLGCGTLVTSSYPPLHSLGVVSVVTLVTCLAGALLVLPVCLMMLSDRRAPLHGERRR